MAILLKIQNFSSEQDHTEVEEEDKAKIAFVKPSFGFVEVMTRDQKTFKWPAILYSIKQNVYVPPHLQLLDSISTESSLVKVTRCHQVDSDGRVEVVDGQAVPTHSTVRLLGSQQLISSFLEIDWKFIELDDLNTVFDDDNT